MSRIIENCTFSDIWDDLIRIETLIDIVKRRLTYLENDDHDYIHEAEQYYKNIQKQVELRKLEKIPVIEQPGKYEKDHYNA